MDGLPVVIRLIDPPLHEFLPSCEELADETTSTADTPEGASVETDASATVIRLLERARRLATKFLPSHDELLAARSASCAARGDRAAPRPSSPRRRAAARRRGHARAEPHARACAAAAWASSIPAIYEMQVRAILNAAARVQAEGITPLPEIMIPLVGT